MKQMTISICLAVALALALLLPQLSMTYTTTQHVIRQDEIRPPCPSGIGTGSAFDGTNLWYSCSAHSTDLYRVGIDGVVTHSYRIDGGLGALAYDPTRNGIWAGWGNGTAGTGVVWFISLDAGKHLVGASLAGRVSEGIPCDLNDGLAYSEQTGNLYFSTACSRTIHRYAVAPSSSPAVGAHLQDILLAGY